MFGFKEILFIFALFFYNNSYGQTYRFPTPISEDTIVKN